jgi:outer membrane protein
MKKLWIIPVIIFNTAIAVQAQSKIAHVDSQQLLDNMPSRKKGLNEINDLSNKGAQELKQLNDKIEKEYKDYLARRGSQSENINKYDEDRIQKMQNDMLARETQIQEEVNTRTTAISDRVLATVKKAVELVAVRKGLDYVLDISNTLFARGADITQEVLAEILRLDPANN